jgi:hypothetical protein
MAKREELEITIGLDGSVHGDVIKGPGGQGCLDNLDEILGGLGAKTAEQKKPEFYQQQQVGRGSVKRGR